MIGLFVERIATRHADGGRYRGAGVPYAEEIVWRFRWLRESGHALAGAQVGKEIEPTREQLVRIALMPDIKEQPIMREIKHAMHRDGQLDNP